jgi:hypothetical protein
LVVLEEKETMFGLFKKKSEKEKLQEQYKKLLKESFDLSKSNRTASDAKQAEADVILKKIEALEK